VLLPSTERLSIPYFHNPQIDAEIAPLPMRPTLPWEREDGYDAKRHWRRDSNAFIHSYGLNAFKSLARSHPAVFARHHPDLEIFADGQVVARGATAGQA
jgi:isopenicillin N synthase-like dioxygenase